MSILDPVQKNLCSDIWQPSKILYPRIKEQILKGLYDFMPKENVMEAYIVGTIAGYQYTETSDIDVNVGINPPELTMDQSVKARRKAADGKFAIGSRHPINYFLVPWKGEQQFWQDFPFGVYDLLNDVWVSSPGEASSIQDPQFEYAMDLRMAKMYYKNFKQLVEKWKGDLNRLAKYDTASNSWYTQYKISILTEELHVDFQNLIDFCHDMDRERKVVYGSNWGVPRRNWRNVVFKYLEASPYGKEFEFFKDLKTPDYYTTFRDIVKEPFSTADDFMETYRVRTNLLPNQNTK